MTIAHHLRVIGLSRGLLLGVLGFTFAGGASAGGLALAGEERTVNVSYAGLDLSDPAAMHSLYGRLKVAARIVCGGDISGVREVERIFAHKACAEDALEAAVRSIDNHAFTALHRRSEAELPLG
jgi:UrcA family protein